MNKKHLKKINIKDIGIIEASNVATIFIYLMNGVVKKYKMPCKLNINDYDEEIDKIIAPYMRKNKLEKLMKK